MSVWCSSHAGILKVPLSPCHGPGLRLVSIRQAVASLQTVCEAALWGQAEVLMGFAGTLGVCIRPAPALPEALAGGQLRAPLPPPPLQAPFPPHRAGSLVHLLGCTWPDCPWRLGVTRSPSRPPKVRMRFHDNMTAASWALKAGRPFSLPRLASEPGACPSGVGRWKSAEAQGLQGSARALSPSCFHTSLCLGPSANIR